MNFDSDRFGPEGETEEDRAYAGSRFAEVRAAIFASAYYRVWGAEGNPPLPVYDVTLGRTLRGALPGGNPWLFLDAARRSVSSRADLRRGPDGLGYRRILHPNGICLTGEWIIDETPDARRYSGYFRSGSRALVIGRYSTCCRETRAGRNRSLALVGKLYPTTDPEHREPLVTANFITQEDLGGSRKSIHEVELRNAPDTTPWKRGFGLPTFLVTGVVLSLADRQPTIRQLYPIAELGKPRDEPTRAPEFMQLRLAPDQRRVEGRGPRLPRGDPRHALRARRSAAAAARSPS